MQPATTLPGEYDFLAAIVADLGDEALRQVYADWLEERGDTRAAFVREVARAAQGLGEIPLPDASPHRRPWTTMLGFPLLEGILELDLVGVKDAVLRLARPIVTIATEVVEGDPF